MEKEAFSQYYIFLILIPVLCGTVARYMTLIIDYRQYPNYPNGYLIHLVTGFISSGIGAIAIPAILEKNSRQLHSFFLLLNNLGRLEELKKKVLWILMIQSISLEENHI
jgi:uncharacterized protein